MWSHFEQRNREIWAGHSQVLGDATHVLGGIGIGMLLDPVLRRQRKSLGWTLILLSTAMHFYADMVKPGRRARRWRRARREELTKRG